MNHRQTSTQPSRCASVRGRGRSRAERCLRGADARVRSPHAGGASRGASHVRGLPLEFDPTGRVCGGIFPDMMARAHDRPKVRTTAV